MEDRSQREFRQAYGGARKRFTTDSAPADPFFLFFPLPPSLPSPPFRAGRGAIVSGWTSRCTKKSWLKVTRRRVFFSPPPFFTLPSTFPPPFSANWKQQDADAQDLVDARVPFLFPSSSSLLLPAFSSWSDRVKDRIVSGGEKI